MAYAVGEDRSDFQPAGRTWAANDFGFTKFTEAANWKSSTARANWANMKAEGVSRGAYHFFHPAVSAGAQASFFLDYVQACGGWRDGDVFAGDFEIALGADGAEVIEDHRAHRLHTPLLRLAPQQMTATVGSGALAFLNAVAARVGPKCPVVAYTYLSFRSQVRSCAKYPLWIADYASSPPSSVAPWSRWTYWQNSDRGGQGGGDTNRFNGDRAALAAWIGSHGSDWTQEAIMALPTLKLGDRDHAGRNQVVGKMQALLSFVGTFNKIPAAAGLKEDGDFGPTTLAAVGAVQKFYGITGGGGECGQRTWEHLIG
jgi:hypothetical protein